MSSTTSPFQIMIRRISRKRLLSTMALLGIQIHQEINHDTRLLNYSLNKCRLQSLHSTTLAEIVNAHYRLSLSASL